MYEINDQVIHISGAAGVIEATYPGEDVVKVHFPEGIALRPNGPVAAHHWHVRVSTLAPALSVGGATARALASDRYTAV